MNDLAKNKLPLALTPIGLSLGRALAFFLALLLISSSCKKDDPAEGIISIGALLPLTGSGSSPGESIQAALELALADINEHLTATGSPCHLELTTEDTGSDTLIAVRKYERLRDKGIQLIIGPCTSANVGSVKPLADHDGILLVSPASVASSLSVAGDNVFRLVPDISGQAEAMAALLHDDSIKVILPVVRDDLWGNELLEATSDRFQPDRISEAIMYPAETTDYLPVVTNLSNRLEAVLANYTPEQIGVYMVSYGEGTDILRLAASASFPEDVRWYGNSAFAENKALVGDFPASVFAATRQLACPAFGHDPTARFKWEPLVNMLEAKLGRKPEIYALAAYDGLWLAALAYLITGNDPDISNLREALSRQAGNYFGATGWTALNAMGDRAQATYEFWGMILPEAPTWQIVATYDNSTRKLTRY